MKKKTLCFSDFLNLSLRWNTCFGGMVLYVIMCRALIQEERLLQSSDPYLELQLKNIRTLWIQITQGCKFVENLL